MISTSASYQKYYIYLFSVKEIFSGKELPPSTFYKMHIAKTDIFFILYLMSSYKFFQLVTSKKEILPIEGNRASANNSVTEDFSEDGDQITTGKYSDSLQSNNCSSVDDMCLRKCGEKGLILRYSYGWVSVTSLYVKEWIQPNGSKNNFTLLFGFPPSRNSTNETICPIISKDEYEFREDSLKLFYKVRNQQYSSSTFCMDSIYHEDGNITEFAVICLEPIKKEEIDKLADSLHKIGLIISASSLAIILVMYVTSPKKFELQLQNKCIISSCVNLFIALLLLIINMTESITTNLHYTICVTLGISIQFFFLSFYFWLNVMIYDISRVIRGSVNMKPLSSIGQKKMRYYYYAMYSWGCPVFISTVTAVMQSLPKEVGLPKEANTSIIRPNIGEGRCWFQDGAALYAYYYGIEITLHVLNTFMIIYAFYLLKGETLLARLSGKKRDNSQFKMRSHTKKNHISMFWQQFYTYILYVFVWTLNVMTLIHPRARFWRVIDIAVSLQGLFLLFIVLKFGNNIIVKNVFESISKMAKSLSPSSSNFSLRTISSKLSNDSNEAEIPDGQIR